MEALQHLSKHLHNISSSIVAGAGGWVVVVERVVFAGLRGGFLLCWFCRIANWQIECVVVCVGCGWVLLLWVLRRLNSLVQCPCRPRPLAGPGIPPPPPSIVPPVFGLLFVVVVVGVLVVVVAGLFMHPWVGVGVFGFLCDSLCKSMIKLYLFSGPFQIEVVFAGLRMCRLECCFEAVGRRLDRIWTYNSPAGK